jgi:hypothetical protein
VAANNLLDAEYQLLSSVQSSLLADMDELRAVEAAEAKEEL